MKILITFVITVIAFTSLSVASEPIIIKVKPLEQHKFDIQNVVQELERAIREQCSDCIERVIDKKNIDPKTYNLLAESFGKINRSEMPMKRSSNTSTSDFDLRIRQFESISDERAVVIVHCGFRRHIAAGKISGNIDPTQTLELIRTESGWKIRDFGKVLDRLTKEAGIHIRTREQKEGPKISPQGNK